ncbi:hypothetical protein AA993_22515 [Pseudomonas putida]|nr:hypothetical protein AA993_22515 [Pseudomonas putida]
MHQRLSWQGQEFMPQKSHWESAETFGGTMAVPTITSAVSVKRPAQNGSLLWPRQGRGERISG